MYAKQTLRFESSSQTLVNFMAWTNFIFFVCKLL